MVNRALVIDANILIRAVLGQHVRNILEAHWESVPFFVAKIDFVNPVWHTFSTAERMSAVALLKLPMTTLFAFR